MKTRIGKSGYKTVGIYFEKKLKNFPIHKLMAINFLNHIPCGFKKVINHKDFNRLNNHIDNLEIVSMRQNSINKQEKNTSIYVGVSWSLKRAKWIAQIHINKKQKYLGGFDNEIDAHHAYQNKLKEIA